MPAVKLDLSEEEEDLIAALDDTYERGKYVRVAPLNIGLSRTNDLDRAKAFAVRADDVFVVTPPKCGTTLMQEVVWLLRNGVDVDLASRVHQFYRVPFLEIGLVNPTAEPYPEGVPVTADNVKRFFPHSFEYSSRLASPRSLKTHLPVSLLPDGLLDKAKVVFVGRNVKDLAVSYWHHHCLSKPALRDKVRVKRRNNIIFPSSRVDFWPL